MTGPADHPEVRVGDREREAALTALGEHLSAGRIDIDEYGDRSATAATARTRGELTALFTDLPSPHPELGSGPAPLPALGESGPGSAATPRVPAVPGHDLPDRTVPEPDRNAPDRNAPDRNAPDRNAPDLNAPAKRAVAASLGVMWAVGVPLLFILGGGHLWWLIFVPIAISVFAGQYWGDNWRGDDGHGHHGRRPRDPRRPRDRRRPRDELR